MRLSLGVLTLINLAAVTTLALAGCTPSDLPKIAACSGSYAGVFTGDAVGSITGSVASDGSLHLEFVPSDPQTVGVLNFTYDLPGLAQATFGPNSGRQTIDGTFNFDNCSVTGNWTLTVTDPNNPDVVLHEFAGTYAVSKQEQ